MKAPALQRLTARQAWERAGMTRNAWNLAPRTRAGRPPPDGHDLGVDFWYAATINDWIGRRRATAAATRHETIIAAVAGSTTDAYAQVAQDLGCHVRTVIRHVERHAVGDCGCDPDVVLPGALTVRQHRR